MLGAPQVWAYPKLMKKSFFPSLFSFACLALIFSACGGNAPPPQSDVDNVIQGTVRDFQNVAAPFLGVNDCTTFNGLVNALPSSVKCDQGGKATVTLVSSSCISSPAFNGTFTINRNSDQCTFNGMSTVGDLTTQLTSQGGLITGDMNAESIIITGILFNFNNFGVDLNAQGTAQSCDGAAEVFNSPCTISSNCQTCPLP